MACLPLLGAVDPGRAAAMVALVRLLPAALGRMPVWYFPSEARLSFDERWALALMRAVEEADAPSATFLLHSRVAPAYRRPVIGAVHAVLSPSGRMAATG
ncbi:MAG: hypothetical protein ACU0CO_03040 [Shimia sp.]